MAVDKTNITEAGLYFITFTNYKWISLFQITNAYDLIYKWLDYLRTKGHHITGYVIMPNHIHALIGFNKTDKPINKIIGDGKRFMAYGIIGRLKTSGNDHLLEQLKAGVAPKDKSRGKLHEVFEPSFDMKECYNLAFINQKLEYMHANPVSKKWKLAENEACYVHSSAKFYQTGVQGVYDVIHYIDLYDKHWEDISTSQP